MSAHGERLALPPSGQGVATCPATGAPYRLEGQVLSPCNSPT
jgi:UDP-2-acetamido-3-amino-2,3-dideoxy-glucuronate N-acetyltransferase